MMGVVCHVLGVGREVVLMGRTGRRIAVVEFRRRADAEAFVDRYYPEVSFPLEHSRGVDSEPLTFRIGFDQGREEEHREKRDDEDWDCVRVSLLVPGEGIGLTG